MVHFPFEFVEQFHEIEGGGTRRGTLHDAPAHRSGFCNTDVTMNDRFQDQTGTEEFLDLLADDLVEVLPLVEHRGQNIDLQGGIVGLADCRDRLSYRLRSF